LANSTTLAIKAASSPLNHARLLALPRRPSTVSSLYARAAPRTPCRVARSKAYDRNTSSLHSLYKPEQKSQPSNPRLSGAMSRKLNIFSNPSVTQSAGLPEGSRPTIPKRKPIPSSQAYERIPQARNVDHGEHEEHGKAFPQGARKSKRSES
jgi:hypothetical protein